MIYQASAALSGFTLFSASLSMRECPPRPAKVRLIIGGISFMILLIWSLLAHW